MEKPSLGHATIGDAPKRTPQISVVIPVHNNARFAARAAISVLRQSVPVREIILVDDASHEADFDQLSRFVLSCKSSVPLRLERLDENVGAGLARHRGANLASGTHVAFLDADDLWHRRKIEVVTRVITRDQPQLVGHLQPWKFKVSRSDLTEMYGARTRQLIRPVFLMLNPMLTSSITVHASIAREMFRFGGRKAEDYMALVIASRMAQRTQFIDAPLAWALKPPFGYSGEGSSILVNYRGSATNMLRLLRAGVIGIGEFALFFVFLAARVPVGLIRQLLYRTRYRKVVAQVS